MNHFIIIPTLLLFATLAFSQSSEREAYMKKMNEARENLTKGKEDYAKKANDAKEAYIREREAYYKDFAKKRWSSFLKVPGVSLPKSPDSLDIKTIEIPKIKANENPNIEIINALLKAGIIEKYAVNIALEIIDSLGIDAIKEGQSIGIYTDENKKGMPAVVKYTSDSSDSSAFLRGKEDGYKYVENDAGKGKRESSYATSANYVFPLKGTYRKTSAFGMREHPILGKPKHHDGVDYGAAKGKEVYAVAGGMVEASGFTDINGNYVAIKHADGITSYYLHLNEKGIAKGSVVEAGQEIGKVGSTGRSTGPHLHLGVMKNGKWEDPEKILGITLSSGVR